jgi:toxin ParE1/3/4
MAVILKHPLAKIDLAGIWDYIAEDSESRADAFIDAIDQNFHVLAEQPALGRSREELAEGLRSFPIGQYIIFYQTIPGGIKIVRVLHGARDLDAFFHPDPDA